MVERKRGRKGDIPQPSMQRVRWTIVSSKNIPF